ncbi:hypothetical protein, variant 1 [Aphanomyces astaci]|uniref:Uncharacterized protein n=1 Tax=Aphanomyces astaci TaxID=112090 RepID=W4FLV2_APHAT|nr:hypothetical protein, variant 1 [Aphanomyces astaci]ETV68502.1 hypothetical protein, variant 1 [Aphanomyces astaci]|eukprot:XP_009841932.1 hypothetical protein, variant 1 [Aphanomyces astaci]
MATPRTRSTSVRSTPASRSHSPPPSETDWMDEENDVFFDYLSGSNANTTSSSDSSKVPSVAPPAAPGTPALPAVPSTTASESQSTSPTIVSLSTSTINAIEGVVLPLSTATITSLRSTTIAPIARADSLLPTFADTLRHSIPRSGDVVNANLMESRQESSEPQSYDGDHDDNHDMKTVVTMQANLDLAITTLGVLHVQLLAANGAVERLQVDVHRIQLSEARAVQDAESARQSIDELREQLRHATAPVAAIASQKHVSIATSTDEQNVCSIGGDQGIAQAVATANALSRVQADLERATATCNQWEARCKAAATGQDEARVEVEAMKAMFEEEKRVHLECQQHLQAANVECANSRLRAEAAEAQLDDLTERLSHVERDKSALQVQIQLLTSRQLAVQHIVVHGVVEKQQRVKDAWQHTKRVVASECKKTKSLFAKWSNECMEICLRHNDRQVDVAQKVATLGLWQQQLRTERSKTMGLQQQLWKATSKHERMTQQLRDELDETRDHLQVLMQVKVGLVADGQASREKISQADAAAAALRYETARLTKLNMTLHQQIQILQHTHARDMERAMCNQHGPRAKRGLPSTSSVNQESEESPTPEDWCSFLDLVMVHHQEVRPLASAASSQEVSG